MKPLFTSLVTPTLLSVAIAASFAANVANAADILTYTNNNNDPGNIALGYNVPIPVDSMTPLDGFRTYSSLNARHQQLVSEADFIRGEIIGQTHKGENIWLYTVSDSNGDTQSGAVEATTLINGGIHAREWQSPEAVTGFMEALFEQRNNEYIEAYLVDNLNMQFIPVLNIDGFKQTQRYPTEVTQTQQSPREGRMRRKNLRDVDFDINTDTDNLLGIDLNRNNEVYWASSTGSSSDPTSLVYHGSGPASEPEIQALVTAANLPPTGRLRLYLDVHSYTQIYFTPMTGNSRRDSITSTVMNKMRAANAFKYRYGPSAAGGGIGTTADYFATIFEVPSATLETEPSANGSADYGGNGVSHDGFILPNNQVRRMVRETTQATFTGFYTQAEKPLLQQLHIRNPDGDIVTQGQWVSSATGRTLVFSQNPNLQNDVEYSVSLSFNKPMRWLDNNQVSHFPSQNHSINPEVQFQGLDNDGNVIATDIDTSNGSWALGPTTATEVGFNRYKTDTFSFTMSLPQTLDWSQLTRMALAVNTVDMVNQPLDANPATVVDWVNGSWHNYENSSGDMLDTGGIDKSFRLIDDGSELFADEPTTPTTPTTPTPTTPPPTSVPSNSSGGGSLGVWCLLLLLVGRRVRRG
ncbi:MAG: hypothetical protein ACI8WB_004291 [Phenylobacterium sp.]|jgi:hypothetical protein